MQLSDQTLAEFTILTLTGTVWSAAAALLASDYRGALTSCTHRYWLFYQRSWYQRTFLWTASSRARYADENHLRRIFRIGAFLGLTTGALILAIEFSALVTGHVS